MYKRQEESQTEDKDWINNWKEYFHQFYVDDILITPSWEPEMCIRDSGGGRSADEERRSALEEEVKRLHR